MNHFDIRIALVDDSNSILMMLTANLKELGYKNIDVYRSASAALDSIQLPSLNYDAIFTDLSMPVSDGMEFIHILGKQAYQCGIVIVSGMDKRVISLASDLARKGMTHLIGNLPKQIFIENLTAIMCKLHLFLQKGV